MTPNYRLAAKKKYRFEVGKGKATATVEDLYSIPLQSLDEMAKDLDKQLKEGSSGSFIPGVKNTLDKTLENKFAIVVDVIKTRYEESEKRKQRAVNQAKVAQLRQVLADKADGQLRDRSFSEIEKMIEELEDNDD